MAHKEPTKKEQALNNFAAFLQKNRIIFILVLAAIVAVILFFVIFGEVKKKMAENSAYRSEAVEADYAAWKTEIDEEKRTASETELFASIDTIVNKYPKTYAAQRSLFIKGLVHWDKKELDDALTVFTLIADRYPQSYLSPISLVNAAVAAEETGNLDQAAELYGRIIKDYKNNFPDMAKTLFSLGRIQEALDKPEEAIQTYTDLTENYLGNSWTNLARNRIIALKLQTQS